MARLASVMMRSVSTASSLCTAPATQWRRCWSSRLTATLCSALVAAETWVRTSMQYDVLVDHPLDAADLALDAPQPLGSARPCSRRTPVVTPDTVPGYASRTASRQAADGVQRRVGEVLGAQLHPVELGLADALVAHRAVQVAGVHALADHGQPPRRERDVVVDAATGRARCGRRSARAARRRSGTPRRPSGRCGARCSLPGSVQYTPR